MQRHKFISNYLHNWFQCSYVQTVAISVPLKKAMVCIKINRATSSKQTCFYKKTARKLYSIEHSSNGIEDTGCSLK